ncbi:MAG: hypothetical protein U1E10_15765 [Bdellovibrionales bacterium]|nr:hypothetical protein [Bdellovibrionales bacterium]
MEVCSTSRAGRSAAKYLNLMLLSGLTVGFAAVGFSSDASAQQAKVVKVSGKKAIVQFPDDARPRVGQMIDLGGGGGESSSGGGGSDSRAMVIGGSAELKNESTSGSSSSTTSLAVTGRYGWNAGDMEYGGLGTLTYASATGSSARVLEAGGFFDYNLVANTPGTELVYGLGAEGKFGSTSATVGNAETTGSRMTFQGGGQLKWFPLGNSVAIRGDAVYRYISTSSGGVSSNTSGLVVQGGFYIYF